MYEIVIRCNTCGEELNRTREMTADEIKEKWSQLNLTVIFAAGGWGKHKHATGSDYNANTGLSIEDEGGNVVERDVVFAEAKQG